MAKNNKAGRKPKHKDLLAIDQVRRWYENVKAKSPVSADIRLRTLGLYCKINNISPMEIIDQAMDNKPTLKNNFEDFVRQQEREGKAGSYIVKFKTLIKSWLDYNGITYPLKVNIAGENESPTTMNERVPLQEEISKIVRFATERGRVAIGIMAFSGCRPETLGNYEGNDGLKLGDFEDLDLSTLQFTKTPSRFYVRSSLSKAKHQYFTFIGSEGQNLITEYLQLRKAELEELTAESPLLQIDLRGQFLHEEKNGERLKVRKSGHTFLRTMLVTRDIRTAMRSAGFDFRPYVLRAYFITALDIAEAKGLISHPWRLFFEGHKGDISSRYSTNKGRLPPDMIDEMRQSYGKCLKYIETSPEIGVPEDSMKAYVHRTMLKIAGYSDDEIASMGTLTDDEVAELAQERMGKKEKQLTPEQQEEKAKNDREEIDRRANGSRQMVISSYLLEAYINEGFEYAVNVGENKCIVKLPPPIPYH